MFELTLRAKKDFSRFGLGLFLIGIVSLVAQGILVALWNLTLSNTPLGSSEILLWILAVLPMYLIAIPIGMVLIRKIPAEAPSKQKLNFGRFLTLMLICMPVMLAGNYIGTYLSALLSGGTARNAVADFVMGNPLYSFIFTVLLAPAVEEYLFRKQIIDRLGKYGELTAILFSAVTFGLFHMNLFQFFYAFGLGLIFAYVYTRTGKLRYPIIMHMIINFLGGVVAPMLVSGLDLDLTEKASQGLATTEELLRMTGSLLGYMAYLVVYLGCVIAGLVLLIVRWKQRILLLKEGELLPGTVANTVYRNMGMTLFLIFSFIMMLLSLF